ncbi:amine oxidase catalytic domain-containing protein [Phlegmacium glaucopus]|nr:amine oxidase catalytic domain-containing protein [Phlegmacium glaucopus]
MADYKPLPLDAPEDQRQDNPTFTISKRRTFFYLSILFNVLSFGLILGKSHEFKAIFSDGIFGHSSLDTTPATVTTTDDSTISRCASSLPRMALPPVPVNLWASLTIPETSAISAWLEAPERNLNLSHPRGSIATDNVIYGIETYYPPKSDAIAYLDNSAASPPPARFARVTIHHGGVPVPAVMDYLVGPLPLGPQTAIRRLKEIYHRDDIPYNARGFGNIEEIPLFLARKIAPVAHAIEELFGGVVRGYENDTLAAGFVGPFSYDGSYRRIWMTWRRNTAGSFILPVNFYNYIDVSGTDTSQWKILKFVYHNQVFSSAESFLEAFNNGTLIRHTEQADPKADYSWPQRQRKGHDRDLDHLPGPRSVSFAGLRYRVDRERQYISWLGWGMYLGFTRDMGLNLWDIRFRGERIIYEVAPQEAMAQYAGNDPAQGSTAWLDRFFGMGQFTKELIPQYDCPTESIYLPATTFSMLGNIQRQRAICIFEQDVGKPLSRHFGYQEGETGAVKSYVLTIRTINTLGNYDYRFDYLFYLDGTMEVRVSASGYMQGGYWNPEQEGYGSRIQKSSMGNVHDHVINFKVDMDIAGTSNSLLRTISKQEEVPRPWLDEDSDWGKTVIEQKIMKEYIENEKDALLRYPPNFTGAYSFVNRDITNAWGYPRGYAVHPGNSPIFNTVVGSKRMLKNANWAHYNLAVSLRKETEPSSSTMWNLNLPGEPMVDFHKFFDGDNITQQDLVAWINVGMHHVPSAEDSPNTKTTIATSSFMLTPVNYFDYDVTLESRNAILIHPPKVPGDAYEYTDHGVKENFHCLPDAPPAFEYTDMRVMGADGFVDVESSAEIRQSQEMFFRLGAVRG